MNIFVALMVALLALSGEVSTQCISRNDALTPPAQPDLSQVAPFSLGLFKEVLPQEGNFIFSPHSVWTALVLTYFGAGGNTRIELENVLRLNNKEEALALYRSIDRVYGGVRRGLREGGRKNGGRMRAGSECRKGRQRGKSGQNETGRSEKKCRGRGRRRRPRTSEMDKANRVRSRGSRRQAAKGPKRELQTANYTIHAANRVYIQEGFTLRKCLRRSLGKELRIIDFYETEAAADTINKFVEGATRGKIRQLVVPSALVRARMALVNAVYFKGFWESQFDPEATRKTPFITSSESRTLTTVDMMRVKATFKTGLSRELNADILEMPYRGGGASMFVLLPRQREGKALQRMLEHLTDDLLHSAMQSLTPQEITVAFPKFKVETTLEEELTLGLTNLGIRDLFSPTANLTAFSAEERLFLNKGIHKAVVEVNEEGAEAAAATALLFFRSARHSSFVCNRPFFFLIRDNAANNILFMGVFREP